MCFIIPIRPYSVTMCLIKVTLIRGTSGRRSTQNVLPPHSLLAGDSRHGSLNLVAPNMGWSLLAYRLKVTVRNTTLGSLNYATR